MTDPLEIAERGQKIYEEKYKDAFEREFLNRFAAIDINTGNVYVADSPTEAILSAQRAKQAGPFHIIKVGAAGVYRVGYSGGGRRDWLFR